jgi:hypothetical protein
VQLDLTDWGALANRCVLYTFFVSALVLVACMPPAAPARVAARPPAPRADFNYSWHLPPEQKATPLDMTVAVVNPSYDDKESVLSQETYRNFAKGFVRSVAVDLDKVLVAKGVKVAGPFASYDEITYSQKRSADLALTPRVFFTATIKFGTPGPVGSGGVSDYIERRFSMSVQGHVVFELREPLSQEKLWVKKLDLEPQTVDGVEAYDVHPVSDPQTGRVLRYDVGDMIYDGKQEGLASVMDGWYPVIVGKAWTFIDTEELSSIKPQVAEIRSRLATGIGH